MPKYATVPLAQLKSDVAVDAVHVKELEDSIKAMGQAQPLLIKEGDLNVIDGFHRAAAMQGLGFEKAEAVLWSCEDEEFWDLRIMSAVLHKNVTFARAVDWIDEAFSRSPWKTKYKNAFNLFDTAAQGYAPKEAKEWTEVKAKTWGLSPRTIRNWLYTKQTLSPELLEEAKSSPSKEEGPSFTHYTAVAEIFPSQPELQKEVIQKSARDRLTVEQLKEVARAVKQAEDERERQTILREPVSRTAEDLTRAAKVEKILAEPIRRPTPREQQYELTGLTLEVYLDLQQQVHNVRRLTPATLEALTSRQRNELSQVVGQLMAELQLLSDSLRGMAEGRLIKGGGR